MKIAAVQRLKSKLLGSEHDHQATTVQWFRAQWPQYALLLYANPNGAVLCDLPERKRKARMGYLIKEGFVAGIPDLFLALPRNGMHGMFIEMKAPGKTICSLGEQQQDALERFRKQGYAVIWASGSDVAIAAIKTYMQEN